MVENQRKSFRSLFSEQIQHILQCVMYSIETKKIKLKMSAIKSKEMSHCAHCAVRGKRQSFYDRTRVRPIGILNIDDPP